MTIERWYYGLNDDRMVQLKAALAVVGAILLLWYWLADDVPLLRRWRRVRDGLLIAVGLVSCASWWNLGRFHFNPFIHYYEFYHYYLGAKYAPELGYTRLYECTVAAEDEFAHLGPRLERAPIRDLTTNVLGSSAEALAHPEKCKAHFTPERWEAFMRDSDFFRRASSWDFWSSGLKDNGYNGTPVWRILGGLFANRVDEMNDESLRHLALPRRDPAVRDDGDDLVGLRLAHAVRGAALLRHQLRRPLLVDRRRVPAHGLAVRDDREHLLHEEGQAVRVRVLHRLRDAVAHLPRLRRGGAGAQDRGGLGARAKKLSITPAQKRWIAGARWRSPSLVPVSTVYGGGVECWRGFVINSAKHLQTPLTNNMGWRTVVAYSRSTRAQVDRDYRQTDPFVRWKQHQLDNFKRAQAGVPRRALRLSRAARDGRREARRLGGARRSAPGSSSSRRS